MWFLYYAIGVIVGIIIGWSFSKCTRTHGVIDIDHNKGVCQAHITSDELVNRKTKRAIFKINHEAIISRDEQVL